MEVLWSLTESQIIVIGFSSKSTYLLKRILQFLAIIVTLTDAIFGLVVLLGELVAVADEQFSSPHIENCPQHQFAIMVVIRLQSTRLKHKARPMTL